MSHPNVPRIVEAKGHVTSWKLGPNRTTFVIFALITGGTITFTASTFNLYQIFQKSLIGGASVVAVRLLVKGGLHMIGLGKNNHQ